MHVMESHSLSEPTKVKCPRNLAPNKGKTLGPLCILQHCSVHYLIHRVFDLRKKMDLSEAVANVLPPTELKTVSTKEIQRNMNNGEQELVGADVCLGEVGESKSFKLVVNNESSQVKVTSEENVSKSSSKTCQLTDRKRNFNATKPAGQDLTQEDVPVSKKRDRRPNGWLKLEEGYDSSWLGPKKSNSKLSCRKKMAAGAKRTDKCHGSELVSRRVKIWRKDEGKYYEGKITYFNCFQKFHRIDYDDGGIELLDMSKGLWKLVDDEESSNVEQENGPVPSASTAVFGNSGTSLSHSAEGITQVASEEATTQTGKNKKVKAISEEVTIKTYKRKKFKAASEEATTQNDKNK